ncbi:hypothetical protein RB653_000533 [Dictyostelium firmibasis]|uniref:Transmembrane protein n=1 Tax=Dictyostelium firmibasis TaxID=79012 RepID=A0AAN7U629_9MYCE
MVINKPLVLIGGYVASINVGAAGLFFYDKKQAVQHKWRVPEKTLHLTGLLGGWIGGMWAMQAFKHKRSKQSFKNVYFTAVAANVGIVGASVLVFKKFPQYIPNQLRILFNLPRNQIQQPTKPQFNQQQQQQQQQQQHHHHQQKQQPQKFESIIEEEQQQINKKKRGGRKNKNNF